MSATQKPTRTGVDIDDDVEFLTDETKVRKELDEEDREDSVGEEQHYDLSIRWGRAMAGRLQRLVHYSSLGLLDQADERRFQSLCDELRALSDLIDRFDLAQPVLTDGPPAATKRYRGGR